MLKKVRKFVAHKEESFNLPFLEDFIPQFKEANDRLERQEFHLIVIGEATKGKSELINGLLGVSVLPTAPRPTTVVPHVIKWGPSLLIKAVYQEGRKDRILAPSDLQSFGADSAGTGVVIHIQSPSVFLKEGLVLIDTPGVNDLNEINEDVLFTQLPSADAALMVIDSRYVLTRTEAEFLTDYLPPGCLERLLFVLTKIDRLDDDEKTETLEWAHEGFKSLSLSNPVFPVSSTKGDGIQTLKDGIFKILRAGNGSASIDSVLARLAAGLGRHKLSITQQLEFADCDKASAKEKVDSFNKMLTAKETKFQSRIKEFLCASKENENAFLVDLKLFALNFKDEISESIKDVAAADVRKYLPFFIRDTYAGWLKKKMNTDENETRKLITMLLDEIKVDIEELSAFVGSSGISKKGSINNVDASIKPGVRLELATGPSIYDFGVACAGAIGTVTMLVNFMAGSLVTAAAAAAAVGFKRFRDEATIEKAIAEAPVAIEETWKKLESEITKHFHSYRTDTSKALNDLANSELSTLKMSVKLAVERANDANVKKESLASQAEDAMRVIDGTIGEITQLRTDIAQNITEAIIPDTVVGKTQTGEQVKAV